MRTIEEIEAEINEVTERRDAAWEAEGEKLAALYTERAAIRADVAFVKYKLEPGWLASIADCAKLALGGLDEDTAISEESVEIGRVHFTVQAEALDEEDEE